MNITPVNRTQNTTFRSGKIPPISAAEQSTAKILTSILPKNDSRLKFPDGANNVHLNGIEYKDFSAKKDLDIMMSLLNGELAP